MAGEPIVDQTLERLVFFSDAVFAIAITLLVIDIHPPHLPASSTDMAQWKALSQLIPSLGGFVISFCVIGLFWMGHHRTFALAARYNSRVVNWNLLFLGVIAFMPFVTAYLSANIGQRVPETVYCFTLLVAALSYYRVMLIVTSHDMLLEDVSDEQIGFVRARGRALVIGAVTSLLLTFVVPIYSQVGMATVPLWRMLLQRRLQFAGSGKPDSAS